MQLSSRCASWRNPGRRRSRWSSPTWRRRGAGPANSCLHLSAWLTACWTVGGTLTWLTPTWRSSWRLAPPRIRILRRGEEPVQVFPADLWPFLSFFQLHLRLLSKDAEVMAALVGLSSRLEAGWTELRASMDQSLCLLAYAKSALLWQPTCFVVSFSFCIFIKVCWRVELFFFPGCVFFFCPETTPKIDRCTLLIQTLETTLLQHWKKSTRQQTRLIMLKTFI